MNLKGGLYEVNQNDVSNHRLVHPTRGMRGHVPDPTKDRNGRLVGAGAGGLIGAAAGNAGMGAAIGAGLGGTGGFLLGRHNESVNRAYERGRASASQGR